MTTPKSALILARHRRITLKGNNRGFTPMAFNTSLSQGDAPLSQPLTPWPVFYA